MGKMKKIFSLIQVDGKNILIDAGTSDNKALNYLKSIGITTLEISMLHK